MKLDSLRVIHQLKKQGLEPLSIPGAFCFDSCQRTLWVCDATDLQNSSTVGSDVYAGIAAYLFLLRVATGLESQIPGETDVFGQVKEAWKNSAQNRALTKELDFWMQRLFEDTKEVRSQYLQNVGGASYGSLVRKIIHDHGTRGPILIVGAGKIAQSIVPYLLEHELWLMNRGKENLRKFHEEISALPGAKVRMILTSEDEARALASAEHAIICVPAGVGFPPRSGCEKMKSIIHLGGLRHQCGGWNQLPGFHPLDDLFELQKNQGELRFTQLARAAKACEEKAKLRSLGASLTIAHGWEDLALFA